MTGWLNGGPVKCGTGFPAGPDDELHAGCQAGVCGGVDE